MDDPVENPENLDVRSCLVLHGLGGGPYELGPLIDAMKASGLRVETPILPGHERSSSTMPHSLWRNWAAAAEAAFDALAREGGPVAVVGFSTGAMLALWLAARRPVARMALLAPFVAIRYVGLIPLRPASYLRHVARFLPHLPRRPPAVRDPAMRRWAAGQDPFKTFSMHATLSALELIDEVKQKLSKINTPTLIIQGKLDTVVEPIRAAWLYDQLGSEIKRRVTMERSDHLVALDHDREHVIAMTVAFVTSGALPANGE